jgi:AcrR family transcriptional regulator
VADHPTKRPGGRSARVRQAVLASTIELLADGGYPDLSLDAVAERSGVHRSTLYRRWGSTSALVLDALLARSDEVVRVPDTGSFERDLRQLLDDVRANLDDPVGAAATIAIAAERSADADEGARRFWEDRLARIDVVVRRAVDRGEIDEPIDSRALVEVAVAPLFFRLLVRRTPVDDDLVEQVVRLCTTALGVVTAPPGGHEPGRTLQS